MCVYVAVISAAISNHHGCGIYKKKNTLIQSQTRAHDAFTAKRPRHRRRNPGVWEYVFGCTRSNHRLPPAPLLPYLNDAYNDNDYTKHPPADRARIHVMRWMFSNSDQYTLYGRTCMGIFFFSSSRLFILTDSLNVSRLL